MDETLNTFLKTIAEEAQADVRRENEAVSAGHETALAKMRSEVQAEVQRFRRAEIAQERNVGSLKVAALQTENRRKLLEYRESCAALVLEDVKRRVMDYTQTAAYREQLAALAQSAISALGDTSGGAVLYLRKEDMRHGDYLKSKLKNRSLCVKEGDFGLGGVIIESAKLCRRVDLSFDTTLRAAQGRFGELSGMELQ